MNAYYREPPTTLNMGFPPDPGCVPEVYENVEVQRNPTPSGGCQRNNNVKESSSVHSSRKLNILIVISGVSFVVGVAALAVAVGLFISLSTQVCDVQTQQSASNKTVMELSEGLKQTSKVLQQQENNFNLSRRITQEQLSDLQKELIQGYKTLEDGWVTPFNGYKYKATARGNSFQNAWRDCLYLGANMASSGIRDLDTRRTLRVALSLPSSTWIGLSDYISEGTWRWIRSYRNYNGDYATEESALWYINRPYTGSSSSSYDCAYMRSDGYSYDTYCSRYYRALCEKPI